MHFNPLSLHAAADINTTGSDMFEVTSSITSDCVSFDIIDDNIIEETETYTITLEDDIGVSVFLPSSVATIVITDNDSKIEYRNTISSIFIN